MATIQNRSRITVTVKNRPDVTRSFPYNALNKVEAYVKELRSQRFRPEAKQGDDTWEVRFREKGYLLAFRSMTLTPWPSNARTVHCWQSSTTRP